MRSVRARSCSRQRNVPHPQSAVKLITSPPNVVPHRRYQAPGVSSNGDNVETVFAQHLQNGSDLVIEHRYVARNDGVFLRAGECGPGIQSHARIDDGAMFFHAQVIAG